MRLLCFGDIVGKSGRKALALRLSSLVEEYGADFIIANGENAAGGFGITPRIARDLFQMGVDVITTGNHVWRNKDVLKIIDKEAALLRPLNFPPGAPGVGMGLYEKNERKIGVVNIMGRIFMEAIDCPFRAAHAAGEKLREQGAEFLIADFHAEATSEKLAMGHYLAELYSLVFGTHTHVQTNDCRILADYTAYMTDLGMTGPTDSVIGVIKERAIKKFVTGMPAKFDLAEGGVEINGCFCEIDDATGGALDVIPIREKVDLNGNGNTDNSQGTGD